jgi:hypothetical protein
MDLTYNISIKDKESGRLSNKETIKNNNNNSSKNIDFNEIGIINSEATIISTQKNYIIEIKGENKNNKSESNLELIKEIKLNLDDNLKNMFNFSYENFHKDNSESRLTTKKSEELSEMDDIDLSENKNENINWKKTQIAKDHHDFQNQISFDENEEKIKERLFNCSVNKLNGNKGNYGSFYQNN